MCVWGPCGCMSRYTMYMLEHSFLGYAYICVLVSVLGLGSWCGLLYRVIQLDSSLMSVDVVRMRVWGRCNCMRGYIMYMFENSSSIDHAHFLFKHNCKIWNSQICCYRFVARLQWWGSWEWRSIYMYYVQIQIRQNSMGYSWDWFKSCMPRVIHGKILNQPSLTYIADKI